MIGFREFMLLREGKQATKSDQTPLPPMLIFKRLSIRVFPDRRQVAEYWCEQIGKTMVYPNSY